jgi:membrane fusion protein, multidrug efflux system
VFNSFSGPPHLRGAFFVSLVVAVLSVTGCGRSPAKAAAGTATPQTAATPVAATTASATPAPGKTDAPATAAAQAAAAAAEAKKAADAARLAAAEAVPVEVAPVTVGPISAFLSFNTNLETESIVDIYPQASGQVEAVLAEEGRIVAEGEPLLKIEDRELRADAEEATATYEHEKKGFARTQDIFERTGLINKQEYDDARYRLDQTRIRHERAQLKLSYATVRAPFAGVITSRDTQVGARVGSGTKAFSMVKLDEIVARVYVPGRYLTAVAENQPAIVTSEFLPNRNFKGWVKRVSPVIDPKSGTFKVTVGVRGDKPSELPPGLFVGVRIVTDTRPAALLVPKRAIVYEGGERYVFTVANDRAAKRKLIVGYEDPQNVEAVSGFEAGTAVVVLGQSGLKDGSLVRLVNAPAAPVALAVTATGAETKAEDRAKSPAADATKIGK